MTDSLRTRLVAVVTDYLNGVVIIDTGDLADAIIRELGLRRQFDWEDDDLVVPIQHCRYVTEWVPDE